ncbi:hypothetical protein NQ318_000714 [Aromia moschata]|uniref:DUF4817 domain-containing protein n=1 Tax=Aromia moschata TaxID=1265417 RepID=A0AAV8XTX7_9CUCU|nr:hypothetical protein NQ318_000714 [Aromia moschata]
MKLAMPMHGYSFRFNVAHAHYEKLATVKCKMPRHNLFSNEEIRDMVCVYSKENFNGRRAYRRYLEMYPNRRQPDFKIFKNLYDRLGETGSFRLKRDSAGRPKTLNPEQEEELLVRVAKNPELSTRRIAMKTGTLLGNPKDKIDNNEKSGIYEICKGCDPEYIGQTKRSICTRFKEHMAHLKYGRTEKSCVAQHAFDNNHRIDTNNLKLIRNVRNSRQLDAFESLEIIKCNNSMNKDNGPIPTSPLFALINKQLRFSEPWQ